MSTLTATQAKDAAIALADDAADVRWKELAFEALRKVAREKPLLQTADVKPHCSMTVREPRAWAGVMMRGQREGVIEPTESFKPSGDVTDHNRIQRVWKSKLFEAPRPNGNLFGDAPPNDYGRI